MTPHPDHPCVGLVRSWQELVSTPFSGRINALCWPRTLEGDFAAVVSALKPESGITSLEDECLAALDLSPAGRQAVAVLLADLQALRAHGLEPTLDCINGYLHEDASGPISTDVCSFHVDSATIMADTYLCSYVSPATLGLSQEQAIRRIDDPETRAKLLSQFGGTDDEDFAEYLSDQCYDLHYSPLPAAQPFDFGVGNLWRIAVAYPGNPVLPCIHRAPTPVPGAPPRLLLLS